MSKKEKPEKARKSDESVLDYYRRQAKMAEQRIKELEYRTEQLEMEITMSPLEKKKMLAKKLDHVLNEIEYLETIPREDKGSVDEAIEYIMENTEPDCNYCEEIEYSINEIYKHGESCPHCYEKMETHPSVEEIQLSFLGNKVVVYENKYASLKCSACGYVIPDLYDSIPHGSVVSDRRIQPELIASVLCKKYCYDISLLSQEMIFKKTDLPITAKIMSSWIKEVCEKWLVPLYRHYRSTILKSRVIYSADSRLYSADDTEGTGMDIRVYVNGKDEAHKAVIYDICKSEDSDIAPDFLADYSGCFCTDREEYYKNLTGKTDRLCSWARIRDKFRRVCDEMIPYAKKGSVAEHELMLCDKLYTIEDRLKGADPELVKMCRQKYTSKIIDEMIEFAVESDVFEKDYLLESDTALALRDLTDNEPRLRKFLKDGTTEPDNISAKKLLMSFSEGEKQLKLMSSPVDAESCAAILSIIGTARINGLSPERYLIFYLHKVSSGTDYNDDMLMPWNTPDECHSYSE